MNTLNRLTCWLRGRCADLARAVRTLWHRLISEPEYAQAAADLLACAVTFWCLTFCCQGQRLGRIVAALAVPWLGMIRNRDTDDPAWEIASWS